MSKQAEFIGKDGEPIELPEEIIRTYNALEHAAMRIRDNYIGARAGIKATKKAAPYLSQAHRDIVNAMPKVLDGSMTINDAMGLLWGYDAQISIHGKVI